MIDERSLYARLAALADGQPVGVAVSGGGDSVALMHFLVRAGRQGLRAVTVDHGLRPDSADEARQVAAMAARLGVPHDTLVWRDWDGQGNLQNAARIARQDGMRAWAHHHGLAAVVLGHTLDDQAETVLMRLARGSGVDGLSAMAAERREDGGFLWLRPLLDVRRAALRAWLRREGLSWIEDPSNDDPRFDRVRARRMLADLTDLGVTAHGVAETATRMAAAREVLAQAAVAAAERLATASAGAICLDAGVWDLPDETRWRLLSGALCYVSGQTYRPAMGALCAAQEALREGKAHTLHSCLMAPERSGLRIQPEPERLSRVGVPVPGTWHGWQVTGPDLPEAQILPVGKDGLMQLDDWRAARLCYDLARTTPGIWRGGQLIAAPALEKTTQWQAEPLRNNGSFRAFLLSH